MAKTLSTARLIAAEKAEDLNLKIGKDRAINAEKTFPYS